MFKLKIDKNAIPSLNHNDPREGSGWRFVQLAAGLLKGQSFETGTFTDRMFHIHCAAGHNPVQAKRYVEPNQILTRYIGTGFVAIEIKDKYKPVVREIVDWLKMQKGPVPATSMTCFHNYLRSKGYHIPKVTPALWCHIIAYLAGKRYQVKGRGTAQYI